MLAEGGDTGSDTAAALVALLVTLVGFVCLKNWVWNSCAWRLRRLGRRERPWLHSYQNITTVEDDKNAWDVYKCHRCGYVLRHDRTA